MLILSKISAAARKSLVLLALFFTFSFASSQIQTKFFGCVLGQTTKATAIANLKSRGITWRKEGANDLFVYQVKFGGYKWDGFLHFYNGKFYKIFFVQTEKLEDNYNVDTNPYSIGIYNNIVSTFDSKYGPYKLPSSSENESLYQDDKTEATIFYSGDMKRYEKAVLLTYTNIYLNSKKSTDEENEF